MSDFQLIEEYNAAQERIEILQSESKAIAEHAYRLKKMMPRIYYVLSYSDKRGILHAGSFETCLRFARTIPNTEIDDNIEYRKKQGDRIQICKKGESNLLAAIYYATPVDDEWQIAQAMQAETESEAGDE